MAIVVSRSYFEELQQQKAATKPSKPTAKRVNEVSSKPATAPQPEPKPRRVIVCGETVFNYDASEPDELRHAWDIVDKYVAAGYTGRYELSGWVFDGYTGSVQVDTLASEMDSTMSNNFSTGKQAPTADHAGETSLRQTTAQEQVTVSELGHSGIFQWSLSPAEDQPGSDSESFDSAWQKFHNEQKPSVLDKMMIDSVSSNTRFPGVAAEHIAELEQKIMEIWQDQSYEYGQKPILQQKEEAIAALVRSYRNKASKAGDAAVKEFTANTKPQQLTAEMETLNNRKLASVEEGKKARQALGF